jgi:hypothetical protein
MEDTLVDFGARILPSQPIVCEQEHGVVPDSGCYRTAPRRQQSADDVDAGSGKKKVLVVDDVPVWSILKV